MTFDIGPFHLYRVEHSGTIDISLKDYPDSSFGWEYGFTEGADRKPLISIRIGKLVVIEFEKFKEGFEIWFMGFWWIK